ncbi:anti-sigma factor [Actinocorallia populi]|uniref:anti-sigma factor n=1 Tax=Actinocorallia populi TaxID=2079200 RepID=UPI000D0939D4|nr:anti-sigma factor [Actinocorallia populi]
MNAHDMHSLLAPYTLHALTDVERRRFEHHLTECESCAEELRGLNETAAMLGVALSRRPPAVLRERVMEEVSRTRQLPPRVGNHRRWRWNLPGTPLLFLAAAAVITAVLFTGFTVFSSSDQVRHPDPQIDAVLSASDARDVEFRLAGGGSGTLVVSRSLNKAFITMDGLPAIPATRAYELWLLGPGTPRPAGLMHDTRGSRLLTALDDATQVGVTVERAEGVSAPTSAPIFTLRLPG